MIKYEYDVSFHSGDRSLRRRPYTYYISNRYRLFFYYKSIFSKYPISIIWNWANKYSATQLKDIGLVIEYLNGFDDTHLEHLSTVYKDVIISRRLDGLIDYNIIEPQEDRIN